MRSAFALRIFRGKFVFISRLSHSAECDKRHFHKWGAEVNCICSLKAPFYHYGSPVKKHFSQARRLG